jgi:hypothetical protein
MGSDEPPIQLPLTEEQQELLHRVTGEHAVVLELVPDPSDPTSGTARGLSFSWRISLGTGTPRQQWILREVPAPAQEQGNPSDPSR